jgi:hypothetical protein
VYRGPPSWREARLSYSGFLGVARCSATVNLRRLY